MAQDSTTIVRLQRELATSELRISGTFGRVELLRSEIGTGGSSHPCFLGPTSDELINREAPAAGVL